VAGEEFASSRMRIGVGRNAARASTFVAPPVPGAPATPHPSGGHPYTGLGPSP
jgi:hypothetical protein